MPQKQFVVMLFLSAISSLAFGWEARAYLFTTSSSINDTTLHIINTSDMPQSFTGTLFNSAGEQLGSAGVALQTDAIASRGRLTITAIELEMLFGVSPWTGPAMLEVSGEASFELMGKLISPSGLTSNTNCVREDRVLNIEGSDSEDQTFVRFINIGSEAITDITGTLYDRNGNSIGNAGTQLVDSLSAKAARWLNRNELVELFGSDWVGEAMLEVSQNTDLRLLNLNFVNGETFFNFSCFESSNTSSRVYLMTNSNSANVSRLNLVNTSDVAQTFTGTLFDGSGQQLGSADRMITFAPVPAKGRAIIDANLIEEFFQASAWIGPAILEVSGSDDFELMIKLESPSGLISNTNCVRENEVHNIEGNDSADQTFVRFINIGDTEMGIITGTLYDSSGSVIGSEDVQILDSLAAKAATWVNRNNLADLFGDWSGEASLRVNGTSDLRLLNLNFANSETFFNFSCFEVARE